MFSFSNINSGNGANNGTSQTERIERFVQGGGVAQVPAPSRAFNALDIFLNGVLLAKDEYTITGSNLEVMQRTFEDDKLTFLYRNE
jgi:hypothetical protein